MEKELIYLYTGNEETIIKVKVSKLIDEIKTNNEGTTEIISYDLESQQLCELLNDAVSIPFLSDNKVIIVKKPVFLTKQNKENPKIIKEFEKYLKNPLKTTVLIIDSTNLELDKDSSTYQELSKYAYFVNTNALAAVEYKGWIKRQFSIQGYTIDDDNVNKLTEFVGQDLIRMNNEIAKIITFKGEDKQINSSDIDNLVNKEFDFNILELLDAVISKDKTRIINIYNNIKNSTNEVLSIVNAISKTLIQIKHVMELQKLNYKQSDISIILNISPGRVYYLMKDTKKFISTTLDKQIIKFAKLDRDIKLGKIDKNKGIEILLLEL